MLHSYLSPHRAQLRSGSRLAFNAILAAGFGWCRSGLRPKGTLSRHRSSLKRLVGFVAALALSVVELSAAGTPTVTPSTSNLAINATTLTITGAGFSTTAADNTVAFSSGTGTVTSATATQLTVTFNTAPDLGTLDAVVTTNGIGSGSEVPVANIVEVPSINSISPAAGPSAGGTTITIAGLSFVNVTAVTIGGIAATNVSVNDGPLNAKYITATTPAGAPGAANVIVTNADGSSSITAIAKFNYTAGAFVKPAVRFSPAFPRALSINGPGSTVTNSASFSVTFNQSVTGVDAVDFSLIATGTVANGTISSITGSGATRTVTVTGITGIGTLGLNLVSLPTIAAAPSFAGQVTYSTGSKPTSVTLGDVNGDGRLDLIIANFDSSTASVLLGNGNGTFQAKTDFVTGANPQSVTLGDVNGDGKLDLITANYSSANVSVLLGNGDGTFGAKTDFRTGTNPSSVKLGDVNGDGTLDIVTANRGSNNVSVLLGTGDGTFSAKTDLSTGNGPYSVTLGDVNGDGKLDIVTGNRSSASVSVLLGNGNGTFQSYASFSAGGNQFAVSLGDVNSDGKIDIVTANTNTGAAVLLGNGNGTFQSQSIITVGNKPRSVTLADVNGDGILDLITSNNDDANASVLLGRGDGTFPTSATFATGTFDAAVFGAATLGDVNGDGRLDIITANSGSNTVSVLLGTGGSAITATFSPQQTFSTPSKPTVAVGDVNGDGRLDIVTANFDSGTVSVLLGNGNGTFQTRVNYNARGNPECVILGDVNGDGRLDIVTADSDGGSNTASVLLGNGDGTFQTKVDFTTGRDPYGVAVGDVNGDGRLDLITANNAGATASVLLGNGDGTFQTKSDFATGIQPQSVALGDVNGDGKLDLITANYSTNSNTVSVLLGNGNGTFQTQATFATGSAPRGLTLGDVNGDGRLDIITANSLSNTVSVLLGNGNGTFQTQVTFAAGTGPAAVTLGDVNGDGKIDLIASNYSSNNASLLLGNGDGTFQTQVTFATGSQPGSVQLGDVNSDGRLDIITGNRGSSTVSVLLNSLAFTGQTAAVAEVPTVTAAPTATGITFGLTLASSALSGGTASVAGTFAFTTPSTAPSVGTAAQGVTFTPTDTTNYTTTTTTANVTVAKATPTITVAPTAGGITYGQTLASSTLTGGTASTAGTFTFTTTTTAPSAGAAAQGVTFTPSSTANYNAVTTTVNVAVAKATPTVNWATPSAISYGTALSATQLNATGSVAGTFAYSPTNGTTPSAGTQTLTATFTPTDSANYNSASATVSLNVIVAVPGSPTSISATTANGEATVTFTAPSNPGSSAITGYTIRATATDGSTVTVNASGSPANITGLTPGKSYRFTVTANNSAGSSATSATSDALTISLVNQTITFASLADRTSNSGSFNLAATASSGLPVTFSVVSGPALLSGNVLDLTGATGTVKIRASQPGNTTYAAAPVVEVSFAVTAGNAQVVLSSVVNPATQKSEGTLGVVLAGSSRSGVLLMVASGNGPSGTAEFTLGAGGSFTASFESSAAPASLQLEKGIRGASVTTADSVTFTFTGSFVNNVLTGSIQPLGYGFKAEAPVNKPASTTSVGLYISAALSAESGTVYSMVGANNEVLVLVKTPTVTIGGLTTLKSDGSYTLDATITSGSVALNGGVNPTTTTSNATLTLPGNTKIDFSGLSTTTKRTDRLINLSSRAKVGTGESVLITGFVIGGTESKKVLIRAAGPALTAFGLSSALPNPTIKIYQGSNLIAQNDDWNKDDAAEIARLGAFAFAVGSKDAALLTTLAPGAYTAQIADPSGTGTGVALAEIYDASINPNADYQRLGNISSRGRVTPDDGVLIGGFIVTGNAPKTLLIRGIGPTLTAFGLAGALADPALTIYQDSKVIATNEGWANSAAITTAAIQTGAFTLPSGSKDAAVFITLNPGAYTAQIKSAKNASSGVALIEIYEVP